MWRLDTAWFWKYLVFHWHSKTRIVTWWSDTGPIDNPDTPVVPCSLCPDWYTCDNWVCKWSDPITPPPEGKPTEINPQIIDPNNPTVQTQCVNYQSKWSWIKTTRSWVISWYDENSWWQWTFRCYNKVVFYWRLNESNPSHQQDYLVNSIRWWAGSYVRSFTVPTWSVDEQSIFKFTVSANWDYTIEIKRKASWDMYYDWMVYQTWHLAEADWELLYIWVDALAEVWWYEWYDPDKIVALYHSSKWDIIHNISRWEITLTKDNWDSITIMDRNLWATKYYNESWATASEWYWNFYQWWNNYWFPESWWVSTSWTQVDTTWYSCSNPYSSNIFITSPLDPYDAAVHQDWSSSANNSLWSNWCIWPCPVWWHIPNFTEAKKLLDYWSYITWIERDNMNTFNTTKLRQFCNNLLMPTNGRRHFNWWYIADRTGSNPSWVLWTTSYTNYNLWSDSWLAIFFNRYWAYAWNIESWSERGGIPFGKINWIAIRPFKNVT